MKQTAVEWIISQIVEDQTIKAKSMTEWINIFEQAKAMEKEQIIESYCQGCFDMWKDDGIVPRETSKQYYNETYEKDGTAN